MPCYVMTSFFSRIELAWITFWKITLFCDLVYIFKVMRKLREQTLTTLTRGTALGDHGNSSTSISESADAPQVIHVSQSQRFLQI